MAFNSFIHTIKTICSSEASVQKSLDRELHQEIDNFITERNRDALVLFLEQGYRFNTKQALNIMKEYYYFGHEVIRENIYNMYESQFKEIVSNNVDTMMDFSTSHVLKKKKIHQFKILATENNVIFNYLNQEQAGKNVLIDNAHTIKILNRSKSLF